MLVFFSQPHCFCPLLFLLCMVNLGYLILFILNVWIHPRPVFQSSSPQCSCMSKRALKRAGSIVFPNSDSFPSLEITLWLRTSFGLSSSVWTGVFHLNLMKEIVCSSPLMNLQVACHPVNSQLGHILE